MIRYSPIIHYPVKRAPKITPLETADMAGHFSTLADSYDQLRDTDERTINLIASVITQIGSTLNLDIATGTGRYPIAIARKHGHKFVCADRNPEMLSMIQDEYTENDDYIQVVKTDGLDGVEKPNGGFGLVTIMNALHHFQDDIPSLTRSVSSVMSDNGYFLVYTRMDDQNSRTIWGEHFPEFDIREDRYLGSSGFPHTKLATEFGKGGMQIQGIETVDLERSNTLPELITKVRMRYYSTFSLYSPEELAVAEKEFVRNIHEAFPESKDNPSFRIPHISPMSLVFATKTID